MHKRCPVCEASLSAGQVISGLSSGHVVCSSCKTRLSVRSRDGEGKMMRDMIGLLIVTASLPSVLFMLESPILAWAVAIFVGLALTAARSWYYIEVVVEVS